MYYTTQEENGLKRPSPSFVPAVLGPTLQSLLVFAVTVLSYGGVSAWEPPPEAINEPANREQRKEKKQSVEEPDTEEYRQLSSAEKKIFMLVKRRNSGKVEIKKVEGRTAIVAIRLFGNVFQDDDLRLLKNLKHVQAVTLSSENFSDSGLKHISGMDGLTTFILLDSSVTDKGFAFLHSIPSVESLSLSGLAISDVGLSHLASLKLLQRLHFVDMQITGEGLRHFGEANKLKLLQFRNCRRITRKGIQTIRKIPQLKGLEFVEIPVVDDWLIDIGLLTQLTFLGIPGSNTTDKGILHLRRMKKLQVLDLRNTRITDASLPTLRALPALKLVFATGSKITADGISVSKKIRPDLEFKRLD